MKHPRVPIAALLVLSVAAAAGATTAQVAATVNGVELAAWEVERELGANLAYGSFHRQVTPDQRAELRLEARQALVLKELKRQWAVARGVEVDRAAVDAAWQRIRDRFGDEAAYEGALEQQGATHEGFYAAFVRDQLARQCDVEARASASPPTSDEVAAFFELHRDEYVRPEARRFTHLLIPVPPEASRDQWKEAEARGRTLAERAAADPAVLTAEIDRARADLPPRYQDQVGDTGLLHRGSLRPELEEPLFAAELGAVVGPVRTIYGIHVVRVEEIAGARPLALDDVRGAVAGRLEEERQAGALVSFEEELRQAATIEVREWAD